MKQYPQQRSYKIAKFLTSPFSLILASVVVIVLVLVYVGYIEITAQPATKTDQAVIPTFLPARTPSIAPSITPVKSTPTSSSKWMTAQTFIGKGAKKTISLTVPKIWRIAWSCNLSSHNNTTYNLIIHINTITNTILANDVETVCRKNNTHNFTIMHQAGQIYLSIISEGSWVVQVQYLR